MCELRLAMILFFRVYGISKYISSLPGIGKRDLQPMSILAMYITLSKVSRFLSETSGFEIILSGDHVLSRFQVQEAALYGIYWHIIRIHKR